MYNSILAAIDGSPESDAVLDAVSFLAQLTNGKAHVIHIRPSEVVASLAVSAIISSEEIAEGQQIVDNAVARLRHDGVSADGEVDEGVREDVAALLVDRAAALGSDLIAVGPAHYSGITAFLHPSVSRGVAKRSRVSVLLVHRQA